MKRFPANIRQYGTYSTSAPNPNVALGAAISSYRTLATAQGDGHIADGDTLDVWVYKDASNWALYEDAAYDHGNTLVDLSAATLYDSAGTISTADAVSIDISIGQTSLEAAMSDYYMQVAQGLISGQSSVNKFGRSTNVDSGVNTDIWDRANATDDQAIWVAPTTARTHQIVSTDAADDGSPAGTGARTLRVYGLTAWNADEVSEDITLNGTTNVATSNTYVIIHRMKVLTAGTGGTNAGKITATADTDGTVTAQINAGDGQTQMAIYGVPSTKTAYMQKYYCSVIKATVAVSASVQVLVNPEPDANLTTFLVKHTNSLKSDGATYISQDFKPPAAYAGPCIIKIQANATANDTDISAGFDLILVDN